MIVRPKGKDQVFLKKDSNKLMKEKETLQKNLNLLEKRNKMTAPTRGA